MKKNKKIIYFCIALIIPIFFTALGLFIYELYQNDWTFNDTMIKPVIIIIGLVFSFFRLWRNLRSKYPLSFYASSYSKQIGNAFSEEQQRKEKKELLKALAAYSENEPKKSVKLLNALKKKCKNTDDFKVVLLFLGLSYTDLHMEADAIASYNELLTYDAFYPTAWSNLGNIYYNQKDYEKAIKCYESSTKFSPDYPQGFNNLSQTYLIMGEWEKVIPPAEKALSIDSKMYQAESALSIAYFALKDEEKSQYHFEKAVSMGSKAENINAFKELILSGRFDSFNAENKGYNKKQEESEND